MTVPRPASEHAREFDDRSLWWRDQAQEHEQRAENLASALAVMEQERDQLREALTEALNALADELDHYATPDEAPASTHKAIARLAALAVPSSEPAEEQADNR